MRPDYDGVKFYGKEDMGNAIQLKKADSIIFAFEYYGVARPLYTVK